MPKPTTYALTWCPDISTYTVRDPAHDSTLAAVFGDRLTLSSESLAWFSTWLASIPSFAFSGREGRFTARKETKQRGEAYWIAYQRVDGTLRKKYLGKTSELSTERLEETARAITARSTTTCTTLPPIHTPITAQEPPLSQAAWAAISQQTMSVDIGKAAQGPPYDDAPWLLDRSHFPLIKPTLERCPIHPTARLLQRDPHGQAWCSSPTCWRRYNLMRLGALVEYHRLLGYGPDTYIEPGPESWSTYAREKDDERITFSLRQAMQFCNGLGLPVPDLSDQARLSTPCYDAWE